MGGAWGIAKLSNGSTKADLAPSACCSTQFLFISFFFKVLTWKKAAKTSTIIFPVEKKMFQRMRIKDVWSSCFFPVDSDKKFPKNAADSPHHPGYAWV